ncbi:UNVERIFIED_CONTAM: Trihelix transcription factor GT-2 [Sesamum radiatum]|uniref:Trihelix transcription factor GT-2 n=1 Tax=Sesamum radiatum TaxID=300843 RepID=A0AAW2QEA9_SESRA
MGSSGGGDGAAAAAAAAAEPHESGGASGGSSEVGASSSMIPAAEDSHERSGGGNRWPRQETLALLKIRSDMDVAFRDASLKGPLWEEVSRKMAELGFQRSAKKCKEKFENVYKYHKRTKDGRASKSDGKTYRFFDQLEALENAPPPPFTLRRPASAPALHCCPTNADECHYFTNAVAFNCFIN